MRESLLRTGKEIEELYHRHVKTVYRICFSYLKNPADTEDAVQETFVKAIAWQGQFSDSEHEKAWLIVTAANLCKNQLRHWWRRRVEIGEESATDHASAPFEIDETFQAVMELPDKFKTAIYLHYYEGYTSVEIAKILKSNESTVRSNLLRGRKLLKERLGGEQIE